MDCFLGSVNESVKAPDHVLLYNGLLELSFKKSASSNQETSSSVPPNNGAFPLATLQDDWNISADMKKRGGVVIQLSPHEKIHMTFRTSKAFAVVAHIAGRNVVSGLTKLPLNLEDAHLSGREQIQDYLSLPHQKWLDLSAIERLLLAKSSGFYGDTRGIVHLELEIIPLAGMLQPMTEYEMRHLERNQGRISSQEPRSTRESFSGLDLNLTEFSVHPAIEKDTYPDSWDSKSSLKLHVHIMTPETFQRATPSTATPTSKVKIFVHPNHRSTFSPISGLKTRHLRQKSKLISNVMSSIRSKISLWEGRGNANDAEPFDRSTTPPPKARFVSVSGRSSFASNRNSLYSNRDSFASNRDSFASNRNSFASTRDSFQARGGRVGTPEI